MFNLPTQERLLAWQTFRNQLNTLSLEQCVYETNQLWWSAPIGNQYYCHSLPEQWPDPWQLIIDNVYDNISRALGMMYTIHYTNHNCELELACGVENSNEYSIVLVADGKYTLNWDTLVHVNTPTHKAASRFAVKELIKRNNNESNTKSYETRWQQRIN